MPNKRFYFHTTCFFIVTLNGTIVLICLVYFSNSEVFMDTQQICESLRKLKLLLAEKKIFIVYKNTGYIPSTYNMFNLEVDVTNFLCYSRVISLGGRVSLFSLTDSMFSMCIAMTRHNSKPCSSCSWVILWFNRSPIMISTYG